jgi:hypothetical protein
LPTNPSYPPYSTSSNFSSLIGSRYTYELVVDSDSGFQITTPWGPASPYTRYEADFSLSLESLYVSGTLASNVGFGIRNDDPESADATHDSLDVAVPFTSQETFYIPGEYGNLSPDNIILSLKDYTSSAFDSNALPMSVDVDNFESAELRWYTTSGGLNTRAIMASVDSVTVSPVRVPGAAWLLGSALLWLGVVRRRLC